MKPRPNPQRRSAEQRAWPTTHRRGDRAMSDEIVAFALESLDEPIWTERIRFAVAFVSTGSEQREHDRKPGRRHVR